MIKFELRIENVSIDFGVDELEYNVYFILPNPNACDK